jgi:CheY-like chemotaxis protein
VVLDVVGSNPTSRPRKINRGAGFFVDLLVVTIPSGRHQTSGQSAMEILLVEDNPADVYLFQNSMVGQHHVTVAHDGAEALDMLFQRGRFEKYSRPNLVVLDLSLPLLNGHEVINVVKSNSKLRSIPVMVLSGSDYPPDIEKAYDLGASAYVRKAEGLEESEKMLSAFANFWIGSVVYADQDS